MAGEKKFALGPIVKAGLDKALEAQYPVAQANVARLRRVHPSKSPGQLVTLLNTVYLTTVTATGAGAGAAAIVPNGWLQAPVAVGDLLTFLEASVLYALSLAEIHGVNIEDVERRKMLVMAVLVGDGAAKAMVQPLLERTAPFLGKKVVRAIPMAAVDAANKVLGPRFITKYGTKQGVLVLGKQVPMWIGVGIGATGNHVFGWIVIKATRRILGRVPESGEASEGTEVLAPD